MGCWHFDLIIVQMPSSICMFIISWHCNDLRPNGNSLFFIHTTAKGYCLMGTHQWHLSPSPKSEKATTMFHWELRHWHLTLSGKNRLSSLVAKPCLLNPQMYKIPQTHKTFLKFIKKQPHLSITLLQFFVHTDVVNLAYIWGRFSQIWLIW